jgi:hypothetical protein
MINEVLLPPPRWRSRPVEYTRGTWAQLAPLIPSFELRDLRERDAGVANPFLKSVVNVSPDAPGGPIPVGVVSRSYGLVQHTEVAECCLKGLRAGGVDTSDLNIDLGLTGLGEWMHFTVYLPDKYSFVRSETDRLRLRLECFNSVEGSSSLIMVFGWLRAVCSNGLVIGETKADLRAIHDPSIDIDTFSGLIVDAMKEVPADVERMNHWVQTPVSKSKLAYWVNGELSRRWGKKAATRVFHVCESGHDVEFADPFSKGEATPKLVHRVQLVPGSAIPLANLFDVSQSLSWVATSRPDREDRLAWQMEIPGLIQKLEG